MAGDSPEEMNKDDPVVLRGGKDGPAQCLPLPAVAVERWLLRPSPEDHSVSPAILRAHAAIVPVDHGLVQRDGFYQGPCVFCGPLCTGSMPKRTMLVAPGVEYSFRCLCCSRSGAVTPLMPGATAQGAATASDLWGMAAAAVNDRRRAAEQLWGLPGRRGGVEVAKAAARLQRHLARFREVVLLKCVLRTASKDGRARAELDQLGEQIRCLEAAIDDRTPHIDWTALDAHAAQLWRRERNSRRSKR